MKTAGWAVVSLVILGVGAGCSWPWESDVGAFTGTVRYPNGSRANVAFVTVSGQAIAYTDWTGRYKLFIDGSVGDTVTVYARGFCRGTCSGTNYGFTKAILRRSAQVVDIVMDHDVPI